MIQEDKELLIKDLSERLPYGVIVRCNGVPKYPYYDHTETDGDFELLSVSPKNGMATIEHYGNYNLVITNCLPYLRPMSSMTEEEENEWLGLNIDPLLDAVGEPHTRVEALMLRAKAQRDPIDWLNEHQFDHRGLIPMGLALVAPEDMYN